MPDHLPPFTTARTLDHVISAAGSVMLHPESSLCKNVKSIISLSGGGEPELILLGGRGCEAFLKDTYKAEIPFSQLQEKTNLLLLNNTQKKIKTLPIPSLSTYHSHKLFPSPPPQKNPLQFVFSTSTTLQSRSPARWSFSTSAQILQRFSAVLQHFPKT